MTTPTSISSLAAAGAAALLAVAMAPAGPAAADPGPKAHPAAAGRCLRDRPGNDHQFRPPYLAAPADPWLAVAGDRPAAYLVEGRSLQVREDPADCSALHDHCLRDCTWFVEHPDTGKWMATKAAMVAVHFDDHGGLERVVPNYGVTTDGYVAYRTVPASRGNFAAGVRVISLKAEEQKPESEDGALRTSWSLGTVDTVDWDSGRFTYKEAPGKRYYISSARVLVLRYQAGGKVEVIGKRAPEKLAVAAADVILPPKPRTGGSDPWSQVGKDGQPIAAPDDAPLDPAMADCPPARDHCLRPWVWFVESHGELVPARFVDGKMVAAYKNRPIDGAGIAYRTIAPDPKTLRPGQRVFVFPKREPGAEDDAHHARWLDAKIGSIDLAAGRFTIDDDQVRSQSFLSGVRIPVVAWFPGEKAEKVE